MAVIHIYIDFSFFVAYHAAVYISCVFSTKTSSRIYNKLHKKQGGKNKFTNT